MTETHRVIEWAELVSKLSGVEIQHVENPRQEADENELLTEESSFLGLGLTPTTLEAGLMEEITDIARKYTDSCDRTKIPSTSKWRQ